MSGWIMHCAVASMIIASPAQNLSTVEKCEVKSSRVPFTAQIQAAMRREIISNAAAKASRNPLPLLPPPLPPPVTAAPKPAKVAAPKPAKVAAPKPAKVAARRCKKGYDRVNVSRRCRPITRYK